MNSNDEMNQINLEDDNATMNVENDMQFSEFCNIYNNDINLASFNDIGDFNEIENFFVDGITVDELGMPGTESINKTFSAGENQEGIRVLDPSTAQNGQHNPGNHEGLTFSQNRTDHQNEAFRSKPRPEYRPDEKAEENWSTNHGKADIFGPSLSKQHDAMETDVISIEEIGPNALSIPGNEDGDRDCITATSELIPSETNQPSAVSSRMNHCPPASGRSIEEQIEYALDRFYDHAYKQYKIANPSSIDSDSTFDQICRKENLPVGHDLKEFVVSKDEVRVLIQNEVSRGSMTEENLMDSSFMENFANNFLTVIKFVYLCPSCESFFKTAPIFENHFEKREKKMVCPYRCGSSFKYVSTLKRHMKSIHGCGSETECEDVGVFHCTSPGCTQAFQSRKALGFHDLRTHGRRRRVCTVCRATLESAAALRAHLEREHGVIEGEPLPYECDVEGCVKRCRTEAGLNKHKLLKHF